MSDKGELRERVWALLTARRVARFPLPLHDRIPNFAGAELAAERLAETPEWKGAKRLKCNPDAAQRPVRLHALRAGKTVFMAVPRLRDERCFLRLDPAKLGQRLAEAATIAGAAKLGEPVTHARRIERRKSRVVQLADNGSWRVLRKEDRVPGYGLDIGTKHDPLPRTATQQQERQAGQIAPKFGSQTGIVSSPAMVGGPESRT